MTRSFQQPPPQAGAPSPSTGPQRSAPRLRAASNQFDDECLDDPNLQRIDAFLADDDGLDDPIDEV